MVLLKFYSGGSTTSDLNDIIKHLRVELNQEIKDAFSEICFYVDCDGGTMTSGEAGVLCWLFRIPFGQELSKTSRFADTDLESQILCEIGPRLNHCTPFSTNAVSICRSAGLSRVRRIEYTRRLLIQFQNKCVTDDIREQTYRHVPHDKMTHVVYTSPLTSFDIDVEPKKVREVPVIKSGAEALYLVNKELGLAFDDWDINYYTTLFRDTNKRNPTNVECFDLAQSNSEHSRHWFFGGRLFIDGTEQPRSLFQMVKDTQNFSLPNNVIKFSDNSSAIEGFPVRVLQPKKPDKSSDFVVTNNIKRHILLTAETHNFPTGVAPFPGATTGTGGRIRDVQCTGRGAHVVAGTAGYCVGNLLLDGYPLPWEPNDWKYPSNFASARNILISASDGASEYGNKFGEPVLCGFARTCGIKTCEGERLEWIKPIMFSAGLGYIENLHITKHKPEKGMYVVKVGGPAYRIGVGGGAASSISVQGSQASELDYGAVQRGDAEMEQKLNRFIRACVELGDENPIESIHDQGAGGNGNVLKELVEPEGAIIRADKFTLGDKTLSALELWGAEYQESNALLVHPTNLARLQKIATRERCPMDVVGEVTGNGMITLENFRDAIRDETRAELKPVDLDLDDVLGSMPRKEFDLTTHRYELKPLDLNSDVTITAVLHRVLRLPSVASKRYLTNKVDRSVTGLVASQQCVGPLHTPLADVAVTALTYFDTVGAATAIGEQPMKILVSPEAGARMCVGEALTNLVFAKIPSIKHVKCSGNWMWAAKLPGKGAELYRACSAMCEVMGQIGVAIDGGKDSLSMAARIDREKTIAAPGQLVISAYSPCEDIRLTITPDLKPSFSMSHVLFVCFGDISRQRVGGSALAQCYSQLGDESPDLDSPAVFYSAFNVTQQLIKERMLLSGHDVSDGGLLVAALEMAFAGNCSLSLDFAPICPDSNKWINALFNEELGILIQVEESNSAGIQKRYADAGVSCVVLGKTTGKRDSQAEIKVTCTGESLLCSDLRSLRDEWELTSYKLELLQTQADVADAERNHLNTFVEPDYKLNFSPWYPDQLPPQISSTSPRVAVIREEGSNGDREMVAAFITAGFEVWDVMMEDLRVDRVGLDRFSGIALVGGFSYADVLGSAKGWAAGFRFCPIARDQLRHFLSREDTFSLGVCNGCQLMALLGIVGSDEVSLEQEPSVYLDHNKSERFESRFPSVRIEATNSIMLQNMSGSVLGVWVAHGEGQFKFRDSYTYKHAEDHGLIALRYFNDAEGREALPNDYPLNPNGSVGGIAGLVTKDGRHLAMMPHPERCVFNWQWPFPSPNTSTSVLNTSPWLQMFRNAYSWCLEE